MKELEEVRSELVELKKLVQQLLESQGREKQRNFSFEDAAKILGVCPKTVSRMVASGELMPIHLRGKSLIPIEEINRVSRPPRMESNGATEEQLRFDGAAALQKLKELRKKR